MPYLRGYSAEVNGKEAQIEVVFDDLMAVRLEKGENKVVFTYVPEGFFPGLFITLASGLIFATLFFLRKKFRFDLLALLDRVRYVTYYLYCAVFCVALSILYFLPVILRYMVDK